jgi:hypothetical protein
MLPAEKTKLAGLTIGVDAGNIVALDGSARLPAVDGSQLINLPGGTPGSSNLDYIASPTDGTVTSDTGTDATLPAANGTNAGLMLPAEKTKLESLTKTLDDGQTATSVAGTLTLNCVAGAIATYQTTLTENVLLALGSAPVAPALSRVLLYATASGADRTIDLASGWYARGTQIWPITVTNGSVVEIQLSTTPAGDVVGSYVDMVVQ